MESDTELYIQIKVAITLRTLLARNKNSKNSIVNKTELINSYQRIATNATFNLRKATVTDAFSGNTKSSMVTVLAIVSSMGFTMKEFGEIYDNISESEVCSFSNE